MIDEDTLLALLRGLHLAAPLSLLGVVGFIAWLLPAAAVDGREMLPKLIRLWRVSGLSAQRSRWRLPPSPSMRRTPSEGAELQMGHTEWVVMAGGAARLAARNSA